MTGDRDGARILVVDDEPGMLRAVSRILDRHYNVEAARHANAALECLHDFRPEIAILDVRMPDINGFDLMRELQEKQPGIDVILMTGNVEEPDQNLVRAIDAGAFYFIQKPFDRRVLLTLVARCLELRRLRHAERKHAERMTRELEQARRFQESLLPEPSRELCGVRVSARYIACNELAGDLYDYTETDDGSLALLIADVSGHGASAAMMTGIVKSAFRSAYVDGYQPLRVIERLAEDVRTLQPHRFVTLFCGRIDCARGQLTWVSAGHPPALLSRRGDAPCRLESTGPLVCSGFTDLPWEERTQSLDGARGLFLYTDGLIEMPGSDGLYGRERLETLVAAHDGDAATLVDAALASVRDHAAGRPPDDDMTLLAVDL